MNLLSRSVFFLFALSFIVIPRKTGAAEIPPNIVVILGDDQAWMDYGFMGHPVIRTIP